MEPLDILQFGSPISSSVSKYPPPPPTATYRHHPIPATTPSPITITNLYVLFVNIVLM